MNVHSRRHRARRVYCRYMATDHQSLQSYKMLSSFLGLVISLYPVPATPQSPLQLENPQDFQPVTMESELPRMDLVLEHVLLEEVDLADSSSDRRGWVTIPLQASHIEGHIHVAHYLTNFSHDCGPSAFHRPGLPSPEGAVDGVSS